MGVLDMDDKRGVLFAGRCKSFGRIRRALWRRCVLMNFLYRAEIKGSFKSCGVLQYLINRSLVREIKPVGGGQSKRALGE